MTRPPLTMSVCVHYRGSLSVCGAGIDASKLGDLHGRIPCLTIRELASATTCELKALPVADEPGPLGAMLARMLKNECPKCGESIATEMEYGGNIVAMPCQHVLRSDL